MIIYSNLKNLKRPDLTNQIEENQNPNGIRYVYKNSIEDILILSERRTISSTEVRDFKETSKGAKDVDLLVTLATKLEADVTPKSADSNSASFLSPSIVSFSSSRGSVNSLNLTSIEIT